jgi:hypothetical protein
MGKEQQRTKTNAPTEVTPNTPVASPATNAAAASNNIAGLNSTSANITNTSSQVESESNSTNSSKALMFKYISDVAVATNVVKDKKISETNLYDVQEVIGEATNGVEDKQLINHASMAYLTISTMLFNRIQNHVRGLHSKFIDSNYMTYPVGKLDFKTTELYLNNTRTNSVMVISSSNDVAYTYQFLMLRSINIGITKGKVLSISNGGETFMGDYQLSFDKYNSKFTDFDFLRSFSYQNTDKIEINAMTKDRKPNTEASAILKADIAEVKETIRSTFDYHIDDCNVLKKAQLPHPTIVCSSFAKLSDSDAAIKFITCREIFELARTKPELCGELPQDDEFEL